MAEQVHHQGPRRPAGPAAWVKVDAPRRWPPHQDRELLAGLIPAQPALRRYGVIVNQVAAALHSGGAVLVWLEWAVAGADRAVARLDLATRG